MAPLLESTRRDFIRTGTAALAGAAALHGLPFIHTAHAKPDDPIRVGVIGCGGRGTGAILNVLQAGTRVIYPQWGYHTEDVAENARRGAEGISVVALADLFEDRLTQCRGQLAKIDVTIPDDHCFVGWDAYEKLLAVPEINYVILTEPPHFRPAHLMAAIQAGKHVFMEKPVAVDGPGVKLVLEAGELAAQKGLGIAAGTQRRHDPQYVETVTRLQDGAIGEIHTGRAYWNGGVIWAVPRQEGWSDMEWQVRNWNYFTWLSGDHIVEQHVHNLDVINWVMGAHPIRAHALGGRQARPNDPTFGHVYDHFAVEYEYENGARMYSQCRQMDGTASRVEEAVEGTNGSSNCYSWIRPHSGSPWRYEGEKPNPYEQEHQDLINSIRAGTPINDARDVALSTLTGIMGRESAYTGQPVTWEQALNMRSLGPAKYEFGPAEFPAVAVPGVYRGV
ncbi:MAG TPA: Gfo/Idh/MocA family oxidoreductase [Rhodothermales bacterium]